MIYNLKPIKIMEINIINKVIIETPKGCTIFSAVKNSMKFCQDFNCSAILIFNDRHIEIEPSSKYNDVLANFDTAQKDESKIETIGKLIASKLHKSNAANNIKAKLHSLGAENAVGLNPSKYDEFINYLENI